MKECPTCRLLYDGNLRFCRFDGSPLMNELRADEAVTISLPPGKLSNKFAQRELRRRKREPER
jgi:hypothetical protein